MDAETAARLREPFPSEKVGKLPRVTCGKCRESRERQCDSHKKSKCGDCGNYITSAHIHLDYIGHADVTDRLLSVDAGWTWEPLALDPDGLPKLDENLGMWIRLTVGGVTRLGYGAADGKHGGDAVKETIGDALRNAAMRFGVGLDLWRKEGVVEESTGRRGSRPVETQTPVTPPDPTPAQVVRYDELAKRIAESATHAALRNRWETVKSAYKADEITTMQANELRAEIGRVKQQLPDEEVAADPAEPVTPADAAPPMKDATRRKLFALYRDCGYDGDDNRQQRRDVAGKILDRTVESVGELSDADALLVVAALAKRKRDLAAAAKAGGA